MGMRLAVIVALAALVCCSGEGHADDCVLPPDSSTCSFIKPDAGDASVSDGTTDSQADVTIETGGDK